MLNRLILEVLTPVQSLNFVFQVLPEEGAVVEGGSLPNSNSCCIFKTSTDAECLAFHLVYRTLDEGESEH